MASPPSVAPRERAVREVPPAPPGRFRLPCRLVVVLLMAVAVLAWASIAAGGGWASNAPLGTPVYGLDFSCRQAEWLGEDCHAAYTAIVEQLGVRHIRLSAYWNEIEPAPGQYDFSSIDWQIDEAARHGIAVTLSVGIKAQRSPEFYMPEWVVAGRHIPDGDSPANYPDITAAALAYVRATVAHEGGNPAIEVWQVENEPYVHFWGTAHDWSLPEWFVEREAATVRSADPRRRPLLITHASWLRTDGTWRRILNTADIVGEAVYTRRQRGPLGFVYLLPFHLGPLTPDLPGQERTARTMGKAVWISELQAEPFEAPWVNIRAAPVCDFPSISPDLLRSNLELAQRSGAERAYLWGAEWWYYCLTQRHDASYWQVARQVFAASATRELAQAGVPPHGATLHSAQPDYAGSGRS
jgi:hypothetical protein